MSYLLIIIIIIVSISIFTWLISSWQYDTMMSSMMTFYYSPVALSLFAVIWTAGMAAMMFPAIIPMVLFYNRLINSSKDNKGNFQSYDSSQMLYHRQNNTHRDTDNNNKNYDNIPSSVNQDQNKHRKTYNLSNVFRPKIYYMMIFILSYLAIWAITGIVLLIGWSYALDILLAQFGINDIQPQQQQQQQQQTEQLSINTIYGVLLIISGIYQFSSLKARCLGYCESPLGFFMRRWRKGATGAVKMGTYHGLYCLGCCWPYFLLMVALGWMNIFWMGLFAAIIFAEKIWAKGGLWIARITGIFFISIGILSLTGMILLPSDPMSSTNDSGMMSMDNSMNMDMSSSPPDNMTLHNETDNTSSIMNMNM